MFHHLFENDTKLRVFKFWSRSTKRWPRPLDVRWPIKRSFVCSIQYGQRFRDLDSWPVTGWLLNRGHRGSTLLGIHNDTLFFL